MMLLASLPLAANAFSLGQIRTLSHLGERLQVEIPIVAQADEFLKTDCFQLQKPKNNDGTPWLQKATLSIKSGRPPVLVIISAASIQEPALRIGLQIGCGQAIQRDYDILLSPPSPAKQSAIDLEGHANIEIEDTSHEKIKRIRHKAHVPVSILDQPELIRTSNTISPPPRQDKLMLSEGNPESEPGLRLSHDLASWQALGPAKDRQRQLLRIEYRLLQSVYEQTMSQLDTTEKIRKMESSIDRLEQQAQTLSQAPEPQSTTTTVSTPSSTESSTVTSAPAVAEAKAEQPTTTEIATTTTSSTSTTTVASSVAAPSEKAQAPWWKTVLFFVAIALLIGGWIFNKQMREKRNQERRFSNLAPEPVIDPERFDEAEALDEEAPAKPALKSNSFLSPEAHEQPNPTASTLSPVTTSSELLLSQLSESGASIEEHFEANPVMELAEIMLSFGRVKGAAQALQEFVDSNPEESLKPWIRLMDVYRMAGMRSEFERVAAELNQHFNVEIQLWNEMPAETSAVSEMAAIEPSETLPIEWPKSTRKATTLEEAEHIADRIVALWPRKECSEFLDQLLRSNRGGLRSGFSRSVVEEIMFLVELQATIEEMTATETGDKA